MLKVEFLSKEQLVQKKETLLIISRFANATDEEKNTILMAIEDLERRIHEVKNGTTSKVYWNSEPEQIKMDI
jgi:hypothetical protein